MGLGQIAIDFMNSIAETAAPDGAYVEVTAAALINALVNFSFRLGGIGVELHPVGFNAHDRSRVSGESDVWDLSQHWVG